MTLGIGTRDRSRLDRQISVASKGAVPNETWIDSRHRSRSDHGSDVASQGFQTRIEAVRSAEIVATSEICCLISSIRVILSGDPQLPDPLCLLRLLDDPVYCVDKRKR